jgi:methyl-accepting chemotaxis protein
MQFNMPLRVMIPSALAILIIGGVGALGGTVYVSQAQQNDIVDLAYRAQAQDQHILDLSQTAADIRRLIIHTQEALTDVSATRGLNGMDDGYDIAANAAQEFAGRVEHLELLANQLGSPDLLGTAKALNVGYKTYYETGVEMAKAYVAGGPESGNKAMGGFDKTSEAMQENIDKTKRLVDALVARNTETLHADIEALDHGSSVFASFMYACIFVFLLIGIAFARFIVVRACRPITRMSAYMSHLASGDYSRTVPDTGRADEIGEMASAVEYFRNAVLDRQAARKSEEARRETEIEQERRSLAQKAEADARRQHVIDQLSQALTRLSQGDLTSKITQPFDAEYEELRNRFNTSVATLAASISDVMTGAAAVQNGSREIAGATSDLARRTEQQAATIEEAAAAIEEITSTVRNSTQRAGEAADVMAKTMKSAEASSTVVTKAIGAMEQIAASSGEIGTIINVIDTIAFQTNLLALNAGVEAARAGDAGKGFAVVAQEVRDLASRSANAAKEIKALIEKASNHVGHGVELVNSTGQALRDIHGQIMSVSDLIGDISTSAREQMSAIAEVNASVNEMDHVTQKNASMAEETNIACVNLNDEASSLYGAVARFSVERPTDLQSARSQPATVRSLGRAA